MMTSHITINTSTFHPRFALLPPTKTCYSYLFNASMTAIVFPSLFLTGADTADVIVSPGRASDIALYRQSVDGEVRLIV